MKRFGELSPVEKERALDTCRDRIRRCLADETTAGNLAHSEIEQMAREMAREAFYPERGDLFLLIDMEVM